MSEKLYINNKEVPIGENNLIFSKKGYSFTDWITKDIPYSQRVTLPETSLLNSIFLRPSNPEIQGKKFNKFHTYKYSDNGKIVSKGVVKMFGLNENKEYELQLLDSSFELFENIKNKINQIGVDDSDFIFNPASYTTLKTLNSSVFIWPASSMHEDKILANNVLSGNLNYSRPYYSVRRLVEKIFSNNGWSYELGVNCDMFNNLIISANSEFMFCSYDKKFNTTLTAGLITLSAPDFSYGDTVGATTITLANKSKIRLRGSASAQNDFVLQVNVTGSKPQTQNFILNAGTFDYDFTSNSYESGDVVSIQLIGTGSVTFEDFYIYTAIDENDFGDISLGGFVDYKVKAYDNLPDITQKDLFKHCLVKIGGYFNSDSFRKKLLIESVKSLSKLGALDWTDKLIEDSEAVSPLKGYGKINYLEYDVSDIHPSNLGRGTFLIDNETLPDTKAVYKSKFSSSPEVEITDTMIDNTVYGDDDGTDQRINEINTLIGYYQEVSTYTVARFEALNGNNILQEYYANFVKAIQNGELFEYTFNLNKSDFFLFDFKKLVYLQQKDSVFYVLGLSDFAENRDTKVLLLKT
jgi:hypothetical protein